MHVNLDDLISTLWNDSAPEGGHVRSWPSVGAVKLAYFERARETPAPTVRKAMPAAPSARANSNGQPPEEGALEPVEGSPGSDPGGFGGG